MQNLGTTITNRTGKLGPYLELTWDSDCFGFPPANFALATVFPRWDLAQEVCCLGVRVIRGSYAC